MSEEKMLEILNSYKKIIEKDPQIQELVFEAKVTLNKEGITSIVSCVNNIKLKKKEKKPVDPFFWFRYGIVRTKEKAKKDKEKK